MGPVVGGGVGVTAWLSAQAASKRLKTMPSNKLDIKNREGGKSATLNNFKNLLKKNKNLINFDFSRNLA
jgi:hypothetical protein